VTDYHHDHVVVYAELGGALRLARSARAFVTDTVTGLPVDVTQGARTAAYVDSDTDGRATFTATTPTRLRLTNGATFLDVWPIEVSGPDDATVAGLVDAATATQAALDARFATGDIDATVAGLIDTPASATSAQLVAAFAPKDGPLVNVRSFGAVGNGVADDTAALNAAVASGLALWWGGPEKVYRITAALTATLTQDIVWRSGGATILVDSAASIKWAVNIDVAGFDVTIDGPLTIDANRKAFTAWYFNNAGAFSNFSAKGLGARNVFRADTSMTGGDGIQVRGAFTNVFLERPDVRLVTMAAGAGVSGSQGVAGITVSSAGVGLAPRAITILHPYIDGVYCEDLTYQMDQDGIRVFTEEDTGSVVLFETSFNIIGGMIRNCGGRSIKSQCEFGVISGTKIYRDYLVLGVGMRSMPDIDFQVGGGTITNVEVQYVTSVPTRIVNWSGTRQVGGKYSTGLTIDGIKGSITGGSASVFTNIIVLSMYEQLKAVHDISNVNLINNSNQISGDFLLVGGLVGAECIIRLTNISAPCAAAARVVYRSGVAMPTYVSITNFANNRYYTMAYSAAATAGSFTVVTSGQNIRVA